MSDPVNILQYEDKAKADGFRFVFGVDEAGRGPLAGPVVAGAVLLRSTDFSCRITDSKKLSPLQRERAFAEIQDKAFVGIGIAGQEVIDEINILKASHRAMTLAVSDLVSRLPDSVKAGGGFPSSVRVLVDGNSFSGDLPYDIQSIIKGDEKSLSVACASIMAKVTRDRIMDELDSLYPGYGFRVHKGYPTRAHYEALRAYGPSAVHRKTFRLC
jgi:ribonuclease HII